MTVLLMDGPRVRATSKGTADSLWLSFPIWEDLVSQPVAFLSTWKPQAEDVTCPLDIKPGNRLNIGLSHKCSARRPTLPSSSVVKYLCQIVPVYFIILGLSLQDSVLWADLCSSTNVSGLVKNPKSDTILEAFLAFFIDWRCWGDFHTDAHEKWECLQFSKTSKVSSPCPKHSPLNAVSLHVTGDNKGVIVGYPTAVQLSEIGSASGKSEIIAKSKFPCPWYFHQWKVKSLPLKDHAKEVQGSASGVGHIISLRPCYELDCVCSKYIY